MYNIYVHICTRARARTKGSGARAYSMLFARDADPRRRSRSTGEDLCLVIRKLLRPRDPSLTIGIFRGTDSPTGAISRGRLRPSRGGTR